MSLQDPLADLFSRIRNAQLRKKKVVTSPLSKMRESILEVLKNEGYIRGYARTKPGRRVYSGVERIPFVHNGLGISIISTSQGVMSDTDAREKKIGGEIICRVF